MTLIFIHAHDDVTTWKYITDPLLCGFSSQKAIKTELWFCLFLTWISRWICRPPTKITYVTACAIAQLPGMFLSSKLLWEYWIELVIMDLLYIRLCDWLSLCCLSHELPMIFDKSVLNDSCSIRLILWRIVFLHHIWIYIYDIYLTVFIDIHH